MSLKQINKIDEEIARLNYKKEEIIDKQEGKKYCPHCRKFYPSSKCKTWLEFSGNGDFLEEIVYKCPKGHEWDEK